MDSQIVLTTKHLEELSSYVIDQKFIDEIPEILVLVLESKSIDTKDDKQNWFNLLPLMNSEQIEKLRSILLKEKNKLEEIEQRYENKRKELKDSYTQQRTQQGYMNHLDGIKKEESLNQQQDIQDAEDLLDSI